MIKITKSNDKITIWHGYSLQYNAILPSYTKNQDCRPKENKNMIFLRDTDIIQTIVPIQSGSEE